jgi:hypothetical protein
MTRATPGMRWISVRTSLVGSGWSDPFYFFAEGIPMVIFYD